MDGMEAVLLTGGASRRMGTDKASLLVGGEPLALRIARLIGALGIEVTVLGRTPLAGYAFAADEHEFAGPLAALARFHPKRELVFVASCDLVGFDSRVVPILSERIGDHNAAIPRSGGRVQPLCGLYRATTFEVASRLHGEGERRVMKWLECLDLTIVDDIDPSWLANVNTPGDLP